MDRQVTVYQSQEVSTWTPGRYDLTIEQVIAAWLDAKVNRSGSEKTKRAYEDTLNQFRALLLSTGLDMFADDTALVSLAIQGFAGRSATGKEISGATFNQRCAILSSFYEYAIKRGATKGNPVKLVERHNATAKDAAMFLPSSTVKNGLLSIDRNTVSGLRDYALLSLALATGRRAMELAHLTWNDVRIQGDKLLITFTRCKGNKQMSDEIKPKTRKALEAYLQAFYGAKLGTLDNTAPVFVSLSKNNYGGFMSVQAISDICKKHLDTSKVHATRHTFAIAMEEAGAKLSDIGARLGHSDLKTTSKYMERLHSAENAYADELENMFGI